MRLDKFLSEMGVLTRKETALLAKKGLITVDGAVVTKPETPVDPEGQTVSVRGETIRYRRSVWIMLNKPQGYVSSTDDPSGPTVLTLLPEREQRLGLFPCGRLDKNTTGLILLTNDGALSHRLLSPKSHAAKEYAFTVKFPLSASDVETLKAGVTIEGGYTTLPCGLTLSEERAGVITLTEGKYHQIKLMMQAVHNQITSLQRISFGGIPLDPALAPGESRELTPEEIAKLENA